MAHLANDRRARIEVLVNAVTEAHQAERIVLVFRLFDVLADLADITDLFEHVEHGFIGAAVCRAPQRGNAGSNSRVRVRAGAACHAHRRRRAVLLVIGVQDEQQVERLRCDRVNLVGLGRHGKQHVQQVLAVVEVVARVHKRLADIQLVGRGRDGWQLGQNPVRKDIAVLGFDASISSW